MTFLKPLEAGKATGISLAALAVAASVVAVHACMQMAAIGAALGSGSLFATVGAASLLGLTVTPVVVSSVAVVFLALAVSLAISAAIVLTRKPAAVQEPRQREEEIDPKAHQAADDLLRDDESV